MKDAHHWMILNVIVITNFVTVLNLATCTVKKIQQTRDIYHGVIAVVIFSCLIIVLVCNVIVLTNIPHYKLTI